MNWDDVKVGDRVVDQHGDEGTIVEANDRQIVVDYGGRSGVVTYFKADRRHIESWLRVESESAGAQEGPMKERYSLIPPDLLREVALALTQGASKVDPTSGKTYTDFGWRSMLEEQGYENVRGIYYDSLMRHLNASLRGEEEDAGSGLSPLVHVICNAFILRDLERLNKEHGHPCPSDGMDPEY